MLHIKPGKKQMGTPPGGWEEREPITGLPATGDSFSGLADDERRLLRLNGKPIPVDLEAQIEARFCEKLPDAWVYDDTPGVRQLPVRHKVMLLRSSVDQKTSRILKAWRDLGRKKLDVKEAERRAAICVKCEANRPIGCLTCDGTYQRLQSEMGNDLKTTLDKRLAVCAVDQVFNKVQVWLSGDLMRRLLPSVGRIKVERYPETCWKLEILTPAKTQETP